MKYIKSLNESLYNIKILKVIDDIVTLINPKGETVTLNFTKHPDYESEWIDEPYEKMVTLMSDDGVFSYLADATTDGNDTYMEINPDSIEASNLFDQEERVRKFKQRMSDKLAKKVKDENDEEARNIAKSGLSKDDYYKDIYLKSLLNNKTLLNVKPEPGFDYYIIALVEEPDYEFGPNGKGRVVDVDEKYIKAPIDFDPSTINDEDTSFLGDMLDTGLINTKLILKDLISKKIAINDSRLIHTYAPSDISNVDQYIEKAPIYSNITKFINEDELTR